MPMLMSFWRLLSDLTRSFLRHGCGSLAASLAFFSLLSVFPLCFMLLYGIVWVSLILIYVTEVRKVRLVEHVARDA